MKKIKIVFVQERLVCGGAEQALYDLIGLLDKEKFDITLFVEKDDGGWNQKFVDAGIHVVFDYSLRQPTVNPFRKLRNLMIKLQVRKAIQNGGEGLLDICCPGADIVVVNASELPKIAFSGNAKTVRYIHGNLETNQLYRDIILRDWEQLNRYDRFICVAQTVKDAFCSATGLDEKARMCFNPMDSDHVRALAQEPVALPEDCPVICAVGRLSAEKAIDRLIYIHKRLLDQGILHKLVIVGDGSEQEWVERMIRITGTEDSVILAGYQSNPYPYMKGSKFLVNASYTEGLPVIAMEALCLGIPVVVPIPSVRELFGGEVCGLVTENDNDSLEAGIKRMLTDEDFYAQAKAGAEKRGAFFDGKRMVQEIENVFLELAGET